MKKYVIIALAMSIAVPAFSYTRDESPSAKTKKEAAAPQPKPNQTVAVGAVRGEGFDFRGNTVENIQDLVVQECYGANLRCMERTDLSAIIAEQDLGASGRAEKGQGKANIGKIKLADVLVSCAITGKTVNATDIGIGTANIIFDLIGLHGVGLDGDRVTMTCRAYDSSTSEILLSKTTPKFAMNFELGIIKIRGSATKAVQRSLRGFFEELRGKLS
ncbi:MAG: hypothetical protein A2W61_03830 [Deltaproteobacteria bacterium RIFCSPLOWO2_01_44_7]|nr:MAG: hypothetical protein A2712_07740 [Deltaproteobacteria bacterium RIFCSPHIGHO2_01_FULL_43_49]OGQ14767.1 MAG: hypothetical protein A3D22_09255 [Deltaproteobacteria bacterium RIFCSPHIGHO2_02_FULL_44_53]OGQ28153.1 MAG: hypothetical protein A3D98_07965 [Deltaproteobacteria bacterium RIFCSPHIGHO2_12_FULL_44_21]OGQ31365.1 MAG: hypothetical protein A2979_08015 [Deltaproteobacteria bacterium RIFCSPLOWO2_01_FULL_45_74]OGQ38641.1 MAG: hypothetical protein A2W61_03830 [Deltaproteobacteria bacterium 